EVTEVKSRQTEEFQSLVTVTVAGGGQELSVSGTRFADGDSRIVRIDGYRVDAIPHGRMVVTRNADVPGVIGLIGTVMGEHDVNIAGMFNARENLGGEAMTVYNVDDPVPQAAIDRLLDDDRITEVRTITLDEEN
ncbi:MAG: phosphoglycerate dehydrogenase, partial [Halobacteriales archaeon]